MSRLSRYSILTVCDRIYFTFCKILVKSILDKCDMEAIGQIRIISNGLLDDQVYELYKLSDKIVIIETDKVSVLEGGVWGKDWQAVVTDKTRHLKDAIQELWQPVLMLDSDMMVLKDLLPLTLQGGDLQVCVRPKNNVKYIGSYFFAMDPKESIEFIDQWRIFIFKRLKEEKSAYESPALVDTVHFFKNYMHIVELTQTQVNVLEPQFLDPETYLIHFKGSSLAETKEQLYKTRIEDRGWDTYVKKYLDNV